MTTPAFLSPSQRTKTRGKAKDGAKAQHDGHAIHDPATWNVDAAIPPGESVNKGGARKGRAEAGTERGRGQQSAGADLALVETCPIGSLASRPALAAEIERLKPGAIAGAVRAMIKGAQVGGAGGAADRAALWRMLGMPWVGEGANARHVGNVLGSAVGAAVATIEQARRHAPVTVGPTIDAKPLEMQAEAGGGLMFAQHEDGQRAGSRRQEAAKAASHEGQGQAAQASPPRRHR